MRFKVFPFYVVLFVLVGWLMVPSASLAQGCSASVVNKAGDTIQVTATLSTTDPNENGEGESLYVTSSGGEFGQSIGFYNAPQIYSFVATQPNETVSGSLQGFDGDESCTIALSDTVSHRFTPQQKAALTNAINDLNLNANVVWVIDGLCAIGMLIPGGQLPGGYCVGLTTTVAGGTGVAASRLSQILATDPPDPNYMQIATPIIPSIPPATGLPAVIAGPYQEVINDEAEIVGIEGAIITCINRASGAQAANATVWVTLQNQAASQYLDLLSGYYARLGSALTVLQNALTSEGLSYTLTTSEASYFESYVASYGLPAPQVAGLKLFGATQTDINNATQIAIVQNINNTAGPINGQSNSLLSSFSTSLGTLAQTLGGSCTTLNMVRASFGQTSQQPGYLSAADLNHDGMINVVDLATAARALPVGTTCP